MHLCTCEALCLSAVSLAWAQPAVHSSPAEARTIPAISVPRDRVEGLVKLDVVVTDASGKPVAGLSSSDLSLLEEGQQQKILSFDSFVDRGAGAEPPIKIILLIDTIELAPELARTE